MSKHVVITGAAGFGGHHCVEHFLEKTDWSITAIVSFKHRGDSARIQEIKKDNPKRLQFIYHDLNGPMNRLVNQIRKVDYIVNYASESHVDRSISDPVPFIQNNVNVMLNMLEFARDVKPKIFIQISTDEVYGAAFEPEFHKEWSSILPSNPYSASKAAQEAIAISYWRTYGVPIILTNTMNLFGESQDTEKFVPSLIANIKANKELIIHGSPSYIGKRHYLHARNLADACLWLLQRGTVTQYSDQPHLVVPDRYHIAGEIEVDNMEMAKHIGSIMKALNLKFKFVDFHHARPGHDRRYALDSSKIRSEGWVQPISFLDSLERMVNWTLARPEWLITR